MTITAVGQFDFDDGGTYHGGSEGGKAHGFGICTGPGGHGEYSGAWQFGFELSGVYTWPNGNDYAGQWMQGKRHGLGVERRGHWVYRGEWTQGFMGRYGIRQSTVSDAKYEGTWTSGLHDGYGLETYSDGGTYQGQWMKGMRHGYGVRKSAPLSKATHCLTTKVRRTSLTSARSEVDLSDQQHLLNSAYPTVSNAVDQEAAPHIGFFLKGKNQEKVYQQHVSFFSKQRSADGNNSKIKCNAGDIVDQRDNLKKDKQQGKVASLSFQEEENEREMSMTETYIGEWKNDKRSGFGVCERSDGLKYEGEWLENCKTGYGVTLFPDGCKEEGKYKSNVLMEPSRKMLLLRATKLRERIDLAVAGAQKAAQIALQKSDIANSRMESARTKAELAMEVVNKARLDSEKAKRQANEIIQSEPNSGQMKVMMRPSIPRQNMVDIQPTPEHNQVQSFPGQPDYQELQRETKYSDIGSLGDSCRHQLASVAEGGVENFDSKQQLARNAQGNDASAKGLDIQTSNDAVPFGRLTKTPDDPTEKFKETSESMLMNIDATTDLNDDDHLAEIENIFSYLEEEEKDMEEPTSPATGYQKIPQGLLSRPSLRNRRDVRCNNLVILNHDSDQKPVKIKRRLTMPCIMKYGTVGPVFGRGTGVVMATASNGCESGPRETIVIDNGVRKHLQEEMEYHPPPLPPDIDPVEEILEPPKELPKRYRLETVKLTKKAELGSLPNVSLFRRLEGRAIPRHEAEVLCQQKREELQRLQEIENELRKRALVLKIGDIKEWCGRHGLSIFLVAVNLALVILFFKLLS